MVAVDLFVEVPHGEGRGAREDADILSFPHPLVFSAIALALPRSWFPDPLSE